MREALDPFDPRALPRDSLQQPKFLEHSLPGRLKHKAGTHRADLRRALQQCHLVTRPSQQDGYCSTRDTKTANPDSQRSLIANREACLNSVSGHLLITRRSELHGNRNRVRIRPFSGAFGSGQFGPMTRACSESRSRNRIDPSMNFIRLLSLTLIACTLCLKSFAAEARPKVIAYVPNWTDLNTFSETIDYAKITHINLAFENPVNESGDLSFNRKNEALIARAHVHEIPILISIGGGAASGDKKLLARYFDLISESKRAAFAAKLAGLRQRTQFRRVGR
jgi:hypothetical protein